MVVWLICLPTTLYYFRILLYVITDCVLHIILYYPILSYIIEDIVNNLTLSPDVACILLLTDEFQAYEEQSPGGWHPLSVLGTGVPIGFLW